LPAEDALALDAARPAKANARVRIAVPILPHIANFDDLDPLDSEPVVDLVRVRPGTALPGDADLILLPGSKATIADLEALRAAGFHIDIAAHRRRGGMVLGLCGGYQMLGRSIADPGGIEGPPATVEALGLLDVQTTLSNDKRLEPVSGTTSDGVSFSGYEMHMGVTEGQDRARPFARLLFVLNPTATFDDLWVDACRSLILVDTLGWPAVSTLHIDSGYIAPSIDISCTFHRARIHEPWLFARGSSVSANAGVVGCEVQVWSRDGALLAMGTSQLLCRPLPAP